MPDEATNAPVPGDFIADASPLTEELDTSAAAAHESVDETSTDDVTPDEVVPDEANASMDPPTGNLADEMAADQVSATEQAPETEQAPAAEQAPVVEQRPRRRRAASRPAGPPVEVAAPAEVPVTTIAAVASPASTPDADTPTVAAQAAPERPRRKRATRAAGAAAAVVAPAPDAVAEGSADVETSTSAQDALASDDRSSKGDRAQGGKDEEPRAKEPKAQNAKARDARTKEPRARRDGSPRAERQRERGDAGAEGSVVAPAGDPTVFPDGAVITQRKPATRRRRRGDAEPVTDESADQVAPVDAPEAVDSEAQVSEAQAPRAGDEAEKAPRSRRRRAGRRQGAPEAVEQDTADDVAAALAQRVADAAPVSRPGGDVAADERDRKLQDLVAALAGADEQRDDDDTAQDDTAHDDTAHDDTAHDDTADEVLVDDQREDADTDETTGDDDAGEDDASIDEADDSEDAGDSERGGRRRRRRRGGRRRRRGGDEQDGDDESDDQDADGDEAPGQDDDAERASDDDTDDAPDDGSEGEQGDGSRRRRRRRRRRGEDTSGAEDDPTEVVVRVREPRSAKQVNDEVTGIEGSTRMEAKRQRRKEGRAAGRSRRPILSEAEFLSRREAVNRKLLIRQRDDYTQLAVLEDDVLVEHYVDRASATSLIGNIYLARVQNVLPSMEAVFIDIGRGRNAVLYAGEVDWDSHGAVGGGRKVEQVFKSGQTVLVQVTKDPVGAKGARLTNHVSLPGRYVVYSPGGHLSGISRKLADTERHRLRDILGELVSDDESVIVRTAAEGASEEELVRDVNRLKAQWEAIQKKVKQGSAPQLLYAEPDLTVRIVRDLFTEDFDELIVQGNGSGEDAFDSIEAYVSHVAPHLHERVKRHDADNGADLFSKYRIDEQIAKALERKVFLPSGGSLVIDRTEAMTVIDVNTGKFTGSGGNLEATVTSNNLEAAEEIVRQLRLRDIGGIIVVDFIDMVLPSNRELLLRRLVECLGRDRTRHQVAEVTSLGLVQMTRKKIGTGLAEAFTEPCDCCGGRGYMRHDEPVESQAPADGGERRSSVSTSRRGGRRRSGKADHS